MTPHSPSIFSPHPYLLLYVAHFFISCYILIRLLWRVGWQMLKNSLTVHATWHLSFFPLLLFFASFSHNLFSLCLPLPTFTHSHALFPLSFLCSLSLESHSRSFSLFCSLLLLPSFCGLRSSTYLHGNSKCPHLRAIALRVSVLVDACVCV